MTPFYQLERAEMQINVNHVNHRQFNVKIDWLLMVEGNLFAFST